MPPIGRPTPHWRTILVVGLLAALRPCDASTRTTISGNRLPDIVPGRPGTDYPVASKIPETQFSCDRYSYSGFFADPETGCQVFHVCRNRVQTSFLCPNGTLFNQRYQICDWWFNVDCSKSPELYELNQQLLKKQPQGLNPTTAAALSLLTTPSAAPRFDGRTASTTVTTPRTAYLTKDPPPAPSSVRVDPMLLTSDPSFGSWTLHHVTPPTSSSHEVTTRTPKERRMPVRDTRTPFGDSPFDDSPFQPASAFAMAYGSERTPRDFKSTRSSYSDSYTTPATDSYDSYRSPAPPLLGLPDKWTLLAKDTDILNNIALSAQFYVGSKTGGKGYLRPKPPSRVDVDPDFHPFQGFQANKNREKGGNQRPSVVQQDFNGPVRQPGFDGQLNRPELRPPFVGQDQQNFQSGGQSFQLTGNQNFQSTGNQNFQSSGNQNFQSSGNQNFQSPGNQNFQTPGSFQTTGAPGSFQTNGLPGTFQTTGSTGSFFNNGSPGTFQTVGSPGSFDGTPGNSGSFQSFGTGTTGSFQNFDGGNSGSFQNFEAGNSGSFQGSGSPIQSFQNVGQKNPTLAPGIQPSGSTNPFQPGSNTGNPNAFQLGAQSPFSVPGTQTQVPSLNPNFDSTSITDFGTPSSQSFPTPPQAQITSLLPVPDIPPTSSIAQVATFPSSDPNSPPATNIRVTLVEPDDRIPIIEVVTVAPNVNENDDFKASPLISVINDNWRPSSALADVNPSNPFSNTGQTGSTPLSNSGQSFQTGSTPFSNSDQSRPTGSSFFSNPGQTGLTGVNIGQLGQIDPFNYGQVGLTNLGQVGQTGLGNFGQYGQAGPIAPGTSYTQGVGTFPAGQNDLYENLQFTVQPGAPVNPFQQIRLPVTAYQPPQSQTSYGGVAGPTLTPTPPSPTPTYSPPKSTYAAPQTSYGPPKSTYGPPQSTYGAPQSSYSAPPKQTYNAPQSSYGVPQQSYGVPTQSYGIPKATYGAPKAPKAHKAAKAAKAYKGNKGKGLKATYGVPKAPKATYGVPQQAYGAPQQTYGAPQQTYGAPQQTYGAPQQTYGAPQQTYGAPQQTYGAPQQTYGAPQQTYGAPQQTYGAPQQTYGAPQQTYGAPQQTYGAPQQTYGAPQQTYGAPQQGYGTPPQNYNLPQQGYTNQQAYTSQLPVGAIGPIPPAHTPLPTNIQPTPQAYHIALNNQANYNVVPTVAPIVGGQYASSVVSPIAVGSQFANSFSNTGFQQNPLSSYIGSHLTVIPATTGYQQSLLTGGRATIQPPQVITTSHLPLEPHPSISIQESRQLPPPVPTSAPNANPLPTKGMEKIAVDSVPMKPSLLLSVNAATSPSPLTDSFESTTWAPRTALKRSNEQPGEKSKILQTASVTRIESFDRRSDRNGVISLTS